MRPERTIATLAGEADFDGFRAAARRLLGAGVEPDRVMWTVRGGSAAELFALDDCAEGAGGGDGAASADAPADVGGAAMGRSASADDGAPVADSVGLAGDMAGAAARAVEGEGEGDAAAIGGGTDGGAAIGRANAQPPEPTPAAPPERPSTPDAPRVPADFIDLCRTVVLHSERTRFALLYRLLWRLQREPGLRHDPLDADAALARRMAQAVRRDLHKMKAFVRFREVQRVAGDGAPLPPLHVAWFEPEHHIVDAAAPFFVRRFTAMPWAILTPERCLSWDGQSLTASPGANRHDAPPADAGEALWLTYYESIFNPARLKLRAMEAEMPRRYWRNLPEARLISTLSAAAHERTGQMVAREARPPARRLPAAVMANQGHAMPTSPPKLPVEQPPRDDTQATARPALSEGRNDRDGRDGRDGSGSRGAAERSVRIVHAAGANAAGRAAALQALQAAAAGCRECPLGALATQTVWGEGPADAQLMLVGEQPGDQEDLQGRPFVGPAGQLLDRALQQLGWDRSLAYVTNAVKHFKYEPRGKRRIHKTPAQREADACEHWLDGEIAAVQPQAIVALGATAARQLLGRPVPVTRERGRWLQRADGLQVLVTLHPSALLRLDPAERDAAYAAWLDDLRLAGRFAVAGPPGDGAAAPAGGQSATNQPAPSFRHEAASANSPAPTGGRPLASTGGA